MKLHVPFCGQELLLTDAQFERILGIVHGCETIERTYKGTGKGFYGHEQTYDIKFNTFSQENFSVSVMTNETMDKYKALIAMRDGNKEI